MDESMLGRYWIYWQLLKLASKEFYKVFLNHKEEKEKMTDTTTPDTSSVVQSASEMAADVANTAAEQATTAATTIEAIAVDAAKQVLNNPAVQSHINTAISKAQLAVQQAMSSTLIHIELLAKGAGDHILNSSSQLVDSLLQNMVAKVQSLKGVATPAPKDPTDKSN